MDKVQVAPRGFEEVKEPTIAGVTVLPVRADRGSAGYDFYLKEDLLIEPDSTVCTATDVKAFMQENEVLMMYIRSSLGTKKHITLSNGTGVIDSTYYGNPTNDGNIHIVLTNNSSWPVRLNKGERVAQGVFMNYLTAGDEPTGVRTGGLGSTGV